MVKENLNAHTYVNMYVWYMLKTNGQLFITKSGLEQFATTFEDLFYKNNKLNGFATVLERSKTFNDDLKIMFNKAQYKGEQIFKITPEFRSSVKENIEKLDDEYVIVLNRLIEVKYNLLTDAQKLKLTKREERLEKRIETLER